MESGELHVRLGRRGRDSRCTLLVRIYSSESPPFDFEVPIYITRTTCSSPIVSREVLGFITERVVEHVERARSAGVVPQAYTLRRLLLEIEPLDLVGLDWESLLSLMPLPQPPIITRFHPVSDMRLVRSVDLPLGVLHVAPVAAFDRNPTANALRYFRYRRVSGSLQLDVAPTLIGSRYEVVHLAAYATWADDKTTELIIESPKRLSERGITVSRLNRILSPCRARMAILQCIDDDSFVPALNFAHRLLRRGGPTTIVVKGATVDYLDNLYMSIVHDEFVPSHLFSGVPQAVRLVLFHGIGGDRVLELQPSAQRLLRDMARIAAAGSDVLQVIHSGKPLSSIGFARPSVGTLSREDKMLVDFESTMLAHGEATRRIYDFSRERGAWIPIAQDTSAQVRAGDQLKSLQRSVDRVVNVGIHDVVSGRKMRPKETLQPGGSYQVSVQIGRRAEWSLIDGTAAFPENVIERQYSKDGIELRVVVFAPAFQVSGADKRLFLGQPPAESDELRFDMRAPTTQGLHRIRVSIYRELNLLQSILMSASVGANARSGRHRQGSKAEVEFALSSTLANVQKFPKRECNFLTNTTDQGTHTLAVIASGLTTTFDFEDSEMRAAVGAAREALYNIAADTSTRPPTYRFDSATNATTIERMEEDILQLAELGFELYSNIVTGKDLSFRDALRKSLGVAGATIQVAAVKSARYVFPWSMVYDHPLVTGSLRLCPQFAKDAAQAPASLPKPRICLADGCPNYGRTDIVCPSGFWGFKHLIEQPLSVSTQPSASGKRDLTLEIDGGPPGVDVTALMIVSRELPQVAAHEKELRGPASFAFQVKDTKVEACECLKDTTRAAHVVYFYCHGGRDKSRTWLGIGTGVKERLLASDLTGLQIDWTDTHPLVFINGCHTADFTTDDLLNFNQVLSYCRAAGVIGTEISVPETLARFFAYNFLLQFYNGATVGEAMREQRLRLLERCNLLGLAYTPYCSVNLKIVHH